jgi:hypothetical protein
LRAGYDEGRSTGSRDRDDLLCDQAPFTINDGNNRPLASIFISAEDGPNYHPPCALFLAELSILSIFVVAVRKRLPSFQSVVLLASDVIGLANDFCKQNRIRSGKTYQLELQKRYLNSNEKGRQ